MKDIIERYPQVDIYMKRKQMDSVTKLLAGEVEIAKGKKIELNIDEFKARFSDVDSQMKTLPATAQVLPLPLSRFG